MPPDYFSNWYLVSLDDKARIVQSYNEILNQETQAKRYVQGDIGNHAVDISPKFYQLTVSSPILIIDSDVGSNPIYDIFDLVLENLIKLQFPITDTDITLNTFTYIMQNANIQLSPESSEITTTLESWNQFNSGLEYDPENYNFIARQAKFYDIQLGVFGDNYLVSNGTLSISVNSNKNFYVPGYNAGFGNTVPLYDVFGYSVTGNVTVIVTPEQYNVLKFYNEQSPGIFEASKNSVFLKVLNRKVGSNNDKAINLGDFMFLPSVELNITANSVITATINFVTMFRRTSTITLT
jgi:hypothetical protein